MARWFRVNPIFLEHTTRNYHRVASPFFQVPIQIWDQTKKAFDETPTPFLWDTGANFAMLSRQQATDYSLRIHETDDRLPHAVSGVGGSQAAWLTTMKVRFPLLSRRRRETDLAFSFHVIVLEKLDMPILGTRDVLQNFTVESTWDGTSFTLVRDHHGEAA